MAWAKIYGEDGTSYQCDIDEKLDGEITRAYQCNKLWEPGGWMHFEHRTGISQDFVEIASWVLAPGIIEFISLAVVFLIAGGYDYFLTKM